MLWGGPICILDVAHSRAGKEVEYGVKDGRHTAKNTERA